MLCFACSQQKSPDSPQIETVSVQKSPVSPQKSPVSPHKSGCSLVSEAKEPCISAKTPCISAKEPCISAKEPCISAKEPCISAKEPDISAQEWCLNEWWLTGLGRPQSRQSRAWQSRKGGGQVEHKGAMSNMNASCLVWMSHVWHDRTREHHRRAKGGQHMSKQKLSRAIHQTVLSLFFFPSFFPLKSCLTWLYPIRYDSLQSRSCRAPFTQLYMFLCLCLWCCLCRCLCLSRAPFTQLFFLLWHHSLHQKWSDTTHYHSLHIKWHHPLHHT